MHSQDIAAGLGGTAAAGKNGQQHNPNSAPKSKMTPATTEFHEAANLFPQMEDAPLAELAADIKANGLQHPIVRHADGRIIDGRNRFLACQRVGVECRYTTYSGADETIVSFVVSHNLRRRHLTTAQRAAVAADIANLRQGARTDLSPIAGMSQSAAAKLLNVSPKSVERAAAVKRADPTLHEKVKAGEMTAGRARAAVRNKVAAKKKPRPMFPGRPDEVTALSIWLRRGPEVLNAKFSTPAEALAKFAECSVEINLPDLDQTVEFLIAMRVDLHRQRDGAR